MTIALNRLFASPIQMGDLNFLQGRVIALKIRDAGIEYRLTFSPDGFRSVSSKRRPDLTMSGTVYDFLLLATRREDPDTLFFQRRLRIDGNAELGLYVKNFLDGLDWDPAQLPLPIRVAFSNAVPLYEWIMN
jgi:predicted lipid carrier protein YhbT